MTSMISCIREWKKRTRKYNPALRLNALRTDENFMKNLATFIISALCYASAYSQIQVTVEQSYRTIDEIRSEHVQPGDVIVFELNANQYGDHYEVSYMKTGPMQLLLASEKDVDSGMPPSLTNKMLLGGKGVQEIKIPKGDKGALLFFNNNNSRTVNMVVRVDRVGVRPEAVTNNFKRLVSIPFDSLGSFYELPKINVVVRPCGTSNAFSTPDIYICSELIGELVEKGLPKAIFPIILHELAHSLMRLWKIGDFSDEDMADEFATVIMAIASPDSVNELARWFDGMDQKSEAVLKTAVNSRHSMSKVRAENMRRLLKNPQSAIAKWSRLMEPHLKKQRLP